MSGYGWLPQEDPADPLPPSSTRDGPYYDDRNVNYREDGRRLKKYSADGDRRLVTFPDEVDPEKVDDRFKPRTDGSSEFDDLYPEKGARRYYDRHQTTPTTVKAPDVDEANIEYLARLPEIAGRRGEPNTRFYSNVAFWKPWGWKTGMLMPLHGIASTLGFAIVMLLMTLAGIHYTWTDIRWAVDGHEEFSEKYDAALIIVNTALGVSGVVVFLALALFYVRMLYQFYKYGVDYLRVTDAALPGIGYTWLIATLCGMTNLTELLLITFVFVMGHLQLAASEYHAYNERLSLGRTGNGRMTWCFGFSAFALMIVLLCLGFTHGTHHHSAGAIIALSFYLVNLAIDLLGSFVVVFLTNKDGIIRDVNHSGLNSEDAAYAAKKCIVKGGGTGLFSKLHLEKGMDFYVQSWYWHMYQLVTWNNIRVVGALSARWAIIVCILTTQVFDKKGQVVY